MSHVVVDPVTRIEGHLRIEAEVDGGSVKDAWSSSTMFRGIELILKGRDPRDAWVFTQRICGVCTTVHAIASVRAVENAIGAKPPPNARLLRNIIMAAQMVQDHVVHFYHLHALDWVDVVSALSADPAKTSALAAVDLDWPMSSTTYFAGVRDRVKAFVDRGQLGPFANAYWGHPAYKLPPEANLMAVAHYLEALDLQREFIRVHAMLGGKNPHLQGFLVGGMATPVDPDKQASLNVGTIAQLKELIAKAQRLRLARLHPRRARGRLVLQGLGGDTAAASATTSSTASTRTTTARHRSCSCPSGVIWNKNLAKVEHVRPGEDQRVRHALLVRVRGRRRQGAAPVRRRDAARSTPGPKPPYERLDTSAKYSWLKSPRYDDHPMEVGPLARMLVAYGRGQPRVKALVGVVLGKLGVGPEALFSTLGRIAARAIETQLLVEKMGELGRRARRQHEARRSAHRTTTTSGTRRRGRRTASAPASTRRRAARSGTGCTSRTAPSRTTSASCRARGTPVRATRAGSAAPTRRRCSERRSRTPSSRSRSCERCTRSIRAWRAASTWSTRPVARSCA